MPLTSRAKMPPPTTTKMRGESRAWLRCFLLLLFAGESKERGGVFPHGRAGERERRRTRRSERREGEKKPSPPEVSSYRNQKKCTNRFSIALSFFPLFFVYTTALTAASPPNKQAPASIATRAEGLDSAAGGTFLLCQARVAAAERQTATPVSRHERQSEVLLFWSSFIPLSLSRRSISSP